MQGKVKFFRNKNGQLEHQISIGNYTLHVIVYRQLPIELLDSIFRQYLDQSHRGRVPLRGEETIKVPELRYIE